MAITHTFVCAIADDATAAANGEVVPSNWNADHAVTNLVLTHGTIATDVNTLGATVTWNAAGVTFTGIKLNVTDTASAAGSLLQDWQVGGVSKASIGKDGVLKLGGPVAGAATFTWSSANSLVLSSTDGYQRVKAYSLWHSNGYSGIGDSGVANGPAMQICSSDGLGWTSAAAIGGGTFDVRLWRDAAATLALRDGTNAQTFRAYGTYTNSSNYVRASLSSSSTAVTLAAETAGTGADNVPVNITPAGTEGTQFTNFAQLTEMTAPAAGAANTARIFAEDNGSGKTRLMVQFASGAAQQIAIEP